MKHRGFTLVELLATIGIVAIISATVIPFWGGSTAYAQQKMASNKASSIDRAKVQYLADNGATAYTLWAALTTDETKYNAIQPYLSAQAITWTTFRTTDPAGYTYTVGDLNTNAAYTKL